MCVPRPRLAHSTRTGSEPATSTTAGNDRWSTFRRTRGLVRTRPIQRPRAGPCAPAPPYSRPEVPPCSPPLGRQPFGDVTQRLPNSVGNCRRPLDVHQVPGIGYDVITSIRQRVDDHAGRFVRTDRIVGCCDDVDPVAYLSHIRLLCAEVSIVFII